ncbi:MAG TPA: Fe-S cluster assembly protein SufD [Opitutaceae bacterium]
MSASPLVSTPTVGSFTREAFEAHLANVSHLPAWWLDRKRAAYERFASLPMPVRSDEFWRFSNLSRLTLDGFEPAAPVVFKDLVHESVGVTGAGHLVFANGRLVATEPLPAELTARGVVFDTIQNAFANHGALVREHLLAQPARLGSAKFAALHEAFLDDGAFIHVPKGVELELPVGVFHYAVGASAAVFPHTLVIAGENSKITVSDFFRSAAPKPGEGGSFPGPQTPEPGPQFACGGNDLYAGHGSQVEYIAMQDWSRDTLSFQFNATVARRDARVLALNLHSGGRQSRHESFSQLQAPGAHSEMLALTIAHGDQEFDQRTLQIHQAPNTSSNLLYKNALLETSKTIFSGLIIVDPDAQKTDAYQSNRNLILSEDAEANSLPGLEIQANDVRCTHGATSSRIPAEQEFYLRSRGINPALAQELIVFGFFEEIVGKIANTELHDQLAAIIRRKFKEQ